MAGIRRSRLSICVCEDNRIEGGCCQDRGRRGWAEMGRGADLEAKARALAELKGYITNLSVCPTARP